MLARLVRLGLFLSIPSVYAVFIGNPTDPALFEKGIASPFSCVSFRMGYQGDWTYKQRFEGTMFVLDDHDTLVSEALHTRNQMKTYAGIATLNFIKRLDLYSILGTSIMEFDNQIYYNYEYSWCIGTKLVFLKHKDLFFGIDFKYFQTNQKPEYFLIEDAPHTYAFNVVSDSISQYETVQAALGIAYRYSIFIPYINATYIFSDLTNIPATIAVRFPDEDLVTTVDLPRRMTSRKFWGMAIGFSLVDKKTASLAVEWRCINENGINVNGELRF